MSNVFVPDVYQYSIYDIDYRKLKEAGIKCISFDVDDTIMGIEHFNVSRPAIKLLKDLEKEGFKILLISNSSRKRVSRIGKAIGIPYIARAEKPHTASFETVIKDNKLQASQMAHVGNCIMNDIAGGNHAGVTTCLVRRAGNLQGILNLVYKSRKDIIQDLESKGLWRKNHVQIKGDQYYQLGETPKYRLQKTG